MRVEVLVRDAPVAARHARSEEGAFASALDAVGALLDGAQSAEDRFAAGRGDLQGAVYARARADIALDVATAAAARVAQDVSTILNMQV